MEHIAPPQPRRTGRPLSFDRQAALDIAMKLFWQHGYEATSIARLTQTMGITPPSLYAAFGDKRGLFREAVQRYLTGGRTVESIIDDAPSARHAAHDLLTTAAIGDTGDDTPPGCLLASSIVTASPEAMEVREELAVIRRSIEASLRDRIERDIADGEVPPEADATALAAHVMSVIQGMSTLAKDGADRTKLLRVVETAMAGWPAKRS